MTDDTRTTVTITQTTFNWVKNLATQAEVPHAQLLGQIIFFAKALVDQGLVNQVSVPPDLLEGEQVRYTCTVPLEDLAMLRRKYSLNTSAVLAMATGLLRAHLRLEYMQVPGIYALVEDKGEFILFIFSARV